MTHETPIESSDVIDYPARDMTITVRAHMSMSTLERILAAEHQQLPIDVPDPSASLAQIVYDDLAGPRQFGYGTLRDYVIGITALDQTGREFHAGGRVVKNVAGYDLCRLMVGSRNELGTLKEITFKLRPIPPHQVLAVASFRSFRDLDAALNRLNISTTTPIILDVASRAASDNLLSSLIPDYRTQQTTACLVVGFDGTPASCEWQLKTLKDELTGTAASTIQIPLPDAVHRYCRIVQRFSVPTSTGSWMMCLNILPSAVAAAMESLQQIGCQTFGRGGNGVVYVRPDQDFDGTEEAKAAEVVRKIMTGRPGSVRVLKGNPALTSATSPEVRQISDQLRNLLGTGPTTSVPTAS